MCLRRTTLHEDSRILLPDRACRKVYRKAPGARLHLRKEDERAQRKATASRSWAAAARLSPWKDENGNYKFYGRFNQGVVTTESGGCGAVLRRRHGEILEDLRRAPRPVLPRTDVPPQPPEGHAVRRGADPLAVRRHRPAEKGRDHRQRFSTAAIPPFRSAMPVCVSACSYMTGKSHTDPQRNAVCARGHEVHERCVRNAGRQRPPSASASTARRSRAPRTSSPSASRSASASSRA